MDMPIKDITAAFKQTFEPQQCKEFYQLTNIQVAFTITKLKQFILHSTLENISQLQLEELFAFIQKDEVIETYMNEFIAPNAPGMMIGKNVEGEFIGSIGLYNQFAKEIKKQEGSIMLAPILIVSAVIQNAYLFINDIETHHDITYCLERCQKAGHQTIDIHDIYEHVVNIIIRPLYEVLNYRIMAPERNVPHYIVTSFGLISGEYALGHGDEIIQQIEQSLSKLMESISSKKEEDTNGVLN